MCARRLTQGYRQISYSPNTIDVSASSLGGAYRSVYRVPASTDIVLIGGTDDETEHVLQKQTVQGGVVSCFACSIGN